MACEDALQEAGLDPIFIQSRDNFNNLLKVLEKEELSKREDDILHLSSSTCLDFRLHEIRRKDLNFSLSSTELRILKALHSQLGSVYPTMDLIDTVWGDSHVGLDNLYVYIRRIREKIEDNPKDPHFLITHHGHGYELRTYEKFNKKIKASN